MYGDKVFKEIDVNNLETGGKTKYDVCDKGGLLLVPANTEVNDDVIHKLKVLAVRHKIGYFGDGDLTDRKEPAAKSIESKKTEYNDLALQRLKKTAEYKEIQQVESEAERLNESYEKVEELFENGDFAAGSDVMLQSVNKTVEKINISALYNTIEIFKDGYDVTYTHSKNVAMMCYIVVANMAKAREISRERLDEVFSGALIHDVGKLKMRSIIEKKGPLTPEERQTINMHPVIGYKMLLEDGVSSIIATMALEHHENGDGSGYPLGKKFNQVQWASQLLHIIDVYEAMITERGYKDPFLPSSVVEGELMGCCYCEAEVSGIEKNELTHVKGIYSSKFVEKFLRYVPIYALGDEVRLSNGVWGVVVKNEAENKLRPMIMVESGEVIDLSGKQFRNLVITGMKSKHSDRIVEASTLDSKAESEFKFKLKQKYKDSADEIVRRLDVRETK